VAGFYRHITRFYGESKEQNKKNQAKIAKRIRFFKLNYLILLKQLGVGAVERKKNNKAKAFLRSRTHDLNFFAKEFSSNTNEG